jgi:asparagine synthase (glutamine-hydrolysing)
VRLLFGKQAMPRWLNQGWFEDKGVARGTCNPKGNRRVLREQLRQALVETSVPALLRYEDRNSMAFSIESRVPFLTADLVQFVFSLPESYLISLQGVTKAVFRESMRGIVPDRVLDRRDKIGFATPEVTWLTALRPWVEETLNSSVMSEIPAVNPSVMRQEWRAALEQRRHFDFRIWRWLNLAHWVRQNAVTFQ